MAMPRIESICGWRRQPAVQRPRGRTVAAPPARETTSSLSSPSSLGAQRAAHTHVTRSLYLHPHQFVCLEQVKLPPFAAAAAEQQATRNKRDERQLLGANSNTIKLASREQSASRLYQRAGKSESASEIHVKGLPGIDAPLYLIAAAHPPSPIRSDSRWRRREEEEFFAQLYWRAAT